MYTLLTTFSFLACALSAQAQITQKDFTGLGNIAVLASDNWVTASPKDKVGYLNDQGKFIALNSTQPKGVFSRANDYPYQLSTKAGNCTFEDDSQPKNTDSLYGKNDNAWSCKKGYEATIYDSLYTVDGFPFAFLCFGDFACYYDAKRTPTKFETLPLWQYHWGSLQLGITPGHIQLQLLWEKVGDVPKRADQELAPGPRMEIRDGLQVPLAGPSES